jgi:hypothetical protein
LFAPVAESDDEALSLWGLIGESGALVGVVSPEAGTLVSGELSAEPIEARVVLVEAKVPATLELLATL